MNEQLWSDERIDSAAMVCWREQTFSSIVVPMRIMRDEYEKALDGACDIIQEKDARIAELEREAAWHKRREERMCEPRQVAFERIDELNARIAELEAVTTKEAHHSRGFSWRLIDGPEGEANG